MRGPSVALLGVFGLVAVGAGQAPSSPGTEAKLRSVLAQPRWSANGPMPEPFAPPTNADPPLPPASLQEPFAIGEALYVEDRVPAAVVSLLAKMHIPIVADGAGAPDQRLQLDRDEVRALIDLDVHDLQVADGLENLPYSFADLHAAVAPLLPRMTVEELAAAYQRAYQAHPGDLVPGVLMGQPIEPDTRLTRAQIWLLLMDGFGTPDGETAWGTADRELPELQSPVQAWSRAEWREVLARLPLVPVRRLLVEDSAVGRLSVRAAPQAPAIVSRVTGRTLIASKAGSLMGQEVTWTLPDDTTLTELATVSTPLGQPVAVSAAGVAQFIYQATPDPTGGRGAVVREWSSVGASLPACPLVSGALNVPQPLCAQLIGDRQARFDAEFSWRTTDRLHVRIANFYTLKLNLPGTGSVKRWGEDVAEGTIVKRPNAGYAGTMTATADSTQTVVGAPQGCDNSQQVSTQKLLVESHVVVGNARPPIGMFESRTKSRELYSWWTIPSATRGATWAVEPPDDGYIGLEFFPDSLIRYTTGQYDPCRPELSAGNHRKRNRGYFLPLNDAQWTTAGGGFLLGVRHAADYYFSDQNSPESLFVDPDGSGHSYSPFWTVRVRRAWLP